MSYTSSNGVSGGAVVTNSITSTVIITVPAGRTWRGSIQVSALSGATTATVANAKLVTVGTGVMPAAGTTLAVAISQSTASGSGSVYHDEVLVVAPSANAVTINLVNSTATTFTGAASCNGILV